MAQRVGTGITLLFHDCSTRRGECSAAHLTCKVEGLGHKLFMDNFFSLPRLFDDLLRRKIHSCGTVRPNRKDMPTDIGLKKLILTKGDIRVRTGGNLTALAWKDRRDIYLLINMDPPPDEGNFCDDSKRVMKSQIVARYDRHMGYVDISGCMANSYSMCRRTFKWTTKLFFHLLDLTVLNSCYLHVGLNVPTKISDYFW